MGNFRECWATLPFLVSQHPAMIHLLNGHAQTANWHTGFCYIDKTALLYRLVQKGTAYFHFVFVTSVAKFGQATVFSDRQSGMVAGSVRMLP